MKTEFQHQCRGWVQWCMGSQLEEEPGGSLEVHGQTPTQKVPWREPEEDTFTYVHRHAPCVQHTCIHWPVWGWLNGRAEWASTSTCTGIPSTSVNQQNQARWHTSGNPRAGATEAGQPAQLPQTLRMSKKWRDILKVDLGPPQAFIQTHTQVCARPRHTYTMILNNLKCCPEHIYSS